MADTILSLIGLFTLTLGAGASGFFFGIAVGVHPHLQPGPRSDRMGISRGAIHHAVFIMVAVVIVQIAIMAIRARLAA